MAQESNVMLASIGRFYMIAQQCLASKPEALRGVCGNIHQLRFFLFEAATSAPRTIRAICRPTSSTFSRPLGLNQKTVQYIPPMRESQNDCPSQPFDRGSSSISPPKIC